MKTRLCDLLGIERPLLSAPMAGAVGPELVAAVSNAGGFGISPLWVRPAGKVREGIEEVRSLTDRNFAVNLNLSFDYQEQLEACIDMEVFAVSLFWGMEPSAISTAKRAGLMVISSVGNAEEARIAEDAGADVICAQGWEAGGHVWGQIGTLALVPAVVDAVKVPVVAAGGIADGRGMAAALILGASGVWVGTRFLASNEATIHQTYLRRVLNASEQEAEWYDNLYDLDWPDAPHRALANKTSAAWLAAERPKPGQRPGEKELIGHRPSGEAIERYQCYTPSEGTTGDVDAMPLWAGQSVSLVRDIKTAGDIVAEICDDAERILDAGLSARI